MYVILNSSSLFGNHIGFQLPDDKLALLKQEVYFADKQRATRHQRNHNSCSQLIRGGRTFSRLFIDILKGMNFNTRIRLGIEFKKDVQWWPQFAHVFNGISKKISENWSYFANYFATDAALIGYGIFLVRIGRQVILIAMSFLQLPPHWNNLMDIGRTIVWLPFVNQISTSFSLNYFLCCWY